MKIHWIVGVALLAGVAGSWAIMGGVIVSQRSQIRDLQSSLLTTSVPVTIDRPGDLAVKAKVAWEAKVAKSLRDQAQSLFVKSQYNEQHAKELLSQSDAIKRQAESHMVAYKKDMTTVYPTLKKYSPGKVNTIDSVSSFRIVGTKAIVEHCNKTSSSVRPNYRVYLFDKHGFRMESFSVSWTFDSVGPGETRVEECDIFAYVSDEIAYFRVD